MLVSIEKTVVTGVAKALMPEESFSGSLDGVYGSVLLDALMIRKIMKLCGHIATVRDSQRAAISCSWLIDG